MIASGSIRVLPLLGSSACILGIAFGLAFATAEYGQAPPVTGRVVGTQCPQHGWSPGLSYCPGCAAQAKSSFGYTGSSGGGNFQQQMMMQGANAFGQALGGMIANSFNDTGPSAAEIEAERQRQIEAERRRLELERQRIEAERRARISRAAALRAEWDSRDRAITEELDGVFELPRGHNTPFFGDPVVTDPELEGLFWDDPNVVDLRDKAAGQISDNPFAPISLIGPVSDSSAVVVSGAGIQTGTVDSAFLGSSTRAREVESFATGQSRWDRFPPLAGRPRGTLNEMAALRKRAGEWLELRARQSVSEELQEQVEKYVQYLPGYGTARRFKGYYQEGRGLFNSIDRQYARTLEQTMEFANESAAVLGSPRLDRGELSPFQLLESQARENQAMAMRLAYEKVESERAALQNTLVQEMKEQWQAIPALPTSASEATLLKRAEGFQRRAAIRDVDGIPISEKLLDKTSDMGTSIATRFGLKIANDANSAAIRRILTGPDPNAQQ